MKALITGASSGIGRDIARLLSKQGYELILVARRIELLEQLKNELSADARIIALDLSDENACFELYDKFKGEVEILVNNAGFGLIGMFDKTDIDRELEIIDVNIRAVHILTKLFLKDFILRDRGYILNVASLAGFLPGPLMSTYYASKAYVLNLSQAIWEELRRMKSRVHISALCPGPVPTEFNKTARMKNVNRGGLKSAYVAEYGLLRMFRNKRVSVPGLSSKFAHQIQRIMPMRALLSFCYRRMKSRQ